MPSNSFLKENISASPIDISGGELEPTDLSAASAVKCAHCHKFYSSFESLKEHIQVSHSEQTIGFPCVQCNAAFSNRDQLDKHEQLHSPHAPVVSQTFSCAEILNRSNFIAKPKYYSKCFYDEDTCSAEEFGHLII